MGIKFDSKLRFDQHILDLCRTASRKIDTLARVTPFMNLSKQRLLVNSFLRHLIWICNSCENNRKINRLHERWLRAIYNDKQSLFHELLEKDGSVSIHQRNLQILATENIYNDKQSSFNELLEKDGSVSIHQRNLQILASENV